MILQTALVISHSWTLPVSFTTGSNQLGEVSNTEESGNALKERHSFKMKLIDTLAMNKICQLLHVVCVFVTWEWYTKSEVFHRETQTP